MAGLYVIYVLRSLFFSVHIARDRDDPCEFARPFSLPRDPPPIHRFSATYLRGKEKAIVSLNSLKIVVFFLILELITKLYRNK